MTYTAGLIKDDNFYRVIPKEIQICYQCHDSIEIGKELEMYGEIVCQFCYSCEEQRMLEFNNYGQ